MFIPHHHFAWGGAGYPEKESVFRYINSINLVGFIPLVGVIRVILRWARSVAPYRPWGVSKSLQPHEKSLDFNTQASVLGAESPLSKPLHHISLVQDNADRGRYALRILKKDTN